MGKQRTIRKEEARVDSARARLARNVRLLLAREGWNQLDLATRAGLSQGMISQLLAGEKGVRLSTLDRVAAALQVDVGALFAPVQSGISFDSEGLDTAVRSAVARMTDGSSQGEPSSAARSARRVLVDPDELREIGLAIGRAIVEATQGSAPDDTTKKADAARRGRADQHASSLEHQSDWGPK